MQFLNKILPNPTLAQNQKLNFSSIKDNGIPSIDSSVSMLVFINWDFSIFEIFILNVNIN